MRTHNLIIVLFTAAVCLLPARQSQAWRGGGGGGFHAGGYGGATSYHAGGFGGGSTPHWQFDR